MSSDKFSDDHSMILFINVQRLLKPNNTIFEQTYLYQDYFYKQATNNKNTKFSMSAVQYGNGPGENHVSRCKYCSSSNSWVVWLVFITKKARANE